MAKDKQARQKQAGADRAAKDREAGKREDGAPTLKKPKGNKKLKEKKSLKADDASIKTVNSAKKTVKVADDQSETAQVLSSTLRYEGPLFKVFSDQIIEPGGVEATRDVVRHGGSVVVLAVDSSKSKRDPMIVMERQYRHAAGRFLYELPAGKIDGNEKRLAAAKRELIEETGYRAKKWTPLVRYYASPGFLAEWMQIFLAEKLTLGDATPEEDERIDLFLISLSEVLRLIDAGAILDGKTLIGVQHYARSISARRKH